MIDIYLIISIALVCHWLGDFVYQDDEMAISKSSSNKVLADHCVTYTGWMSLWFLLFVNSSLARYLLFFSGCFMVHFIVDFFTSRLNCYLRKKEDIHGFFVSVGFDQILHYLTLLGAYRLFT